MSSPSINRWGLNLFWYRFWYNDKINAFFNHQDDLINKFVLIYLHYGIVHSQHLFLSKYWFLNIKQDIRNYYDEMFTQCFRVAEYKNRVTGERKSYKLRLKIKNLYFSKIWILRYQSWIIVNFYCFQPPKKKNSKRKLPLNINESFALQKNSEYDDTIDSNKSLFLRHRIVFFFLLKFYLKLKPCYKF
jgi:hypothetical protein